MFPCSIDELPPKGPKNPKKLPAEGESEQSQQRKSDSISHSDDLIQGLKEWQLLREKEERYYTMVVVLPLAILLLPAIALWLYIIFSPDAFMFDVTP